MEMDTRTSPPLTILRSFEGGAAEVSLADIAQRSGLDHDTTRQALAALCHEGFLTASDHDTYRLGNLLVVLGRRTEESTGLHRAEHLLEQLTARTGESFESRRAFGGTCRRVDARALAAATPRRARGRKPPAVARVGDGQGAARVLCARARGRGE